MEEPTANPSLADMANLARLASSSVKKVAPVCEAFSGESPTDVRIICVTGKFCLCPSLLAANRC